MWLDCDVRDNRWCNFSLDEALLLIMDRKQRFEVKNVLIIDLFFLQTHSFWLLKTLTDGLEWCGLLVDYCDVLSAVGLSFWRHPFTAEHPLLSHWCSDTFLQIWWRNKLIYILDVLRWGEHFQQMFSFGWTVPLNNLVNWNILKNTEGFHWSVMNWWQVFREEWMMASGKSALERRGKKTSSDF